METIFFERLTDTAILPSRAHDLDAGLDLYADETVTLAPGEYKLVRTGVASALDAGYVGMVCPRSGLAGKHGVTVLNAPGIVDAGYRGELRVILINHSNTLHTVVPGDRIAQYVIAKVSLPRVVDGVVTADTTSRGTSGFGSTGL